MPSTFSEPSRPSLSAALWPAENPHVRILRAVALTVLGTLILWASAKVKVPFWPVPMTMQTCAIMLIGLAYGLKLGTATVLLYLAEGAFGLPVFTDTPEKGIGLAYMVGPTGGYLVGFVALAAITGWLSDRGWGRNVAPCAFACLLGSIVLFALGVGWLAGLIGLEKAIQFGLMPFLLAEAVKIVLASSLIAALWRLTRNSPTEA